MSRQLDVYAVKEGLTLLHDKTHSFDTEIQKEY